MRVKTYAQIGRNTEFLELGPTPTNEDCIPVSKNLDYSPRMKAECLVYGRQLERSFPIPEHLDVEFILLKNFHDFGTYYEVAIIFNPDQEEGALFAFHVEENLPLNWDDQATQELSQSEAFTNF